MFTSGRRFPDFQLTSLAGEEGDGDGGNGGTAFDGGMAPRGFADSLVQQPIGGQSGDGPLMSVVDRTAASGIVVVGFRSGGRVIQNRRGVEPDLRSFRLNSLSLKTIDSQQIRVKAGAESAFDHWPPFAINVEFSHVAAATPTLDELEGTQLLKGILEMGGRPVLSDRFVDTSINPLFQASYVK